VTFTEIQTEILDRLNLTSAAATTRIGRAINRLYREVGTSIGLSFMRQTSVTKVVSIGNPEVTFTATEKVLQVWTEDSDGRVSVLDEVMLAALREDGPTDGDSPKRWALKSTASNAVTIRLDRTPETAYTLYASVIAEVTDLSGSTEPGFPESFHDILVEGVLKDELRKMEKPQLARISEETFQRRLSDLRMFVAKSNYMLVRQGENPRSDYGRVTGGGGSSTSLQTSTATITGSWTFDRDPSAPFAVSSGSAVVTNLDADKLDGVEGSDYARISAANTFTNTQLVRHETAAYTQYEDTTDGVAGVVGVGQHILNGASTDTFGIRGANGVDFSGDSGTTRHLRLTNAGILDLLIGQARFPATQNASADANTLDDYKEGVWTPTILPGAGSGITYSVQSGRYTKIGNQVFAQGRLTISGLGTASGSASLDGFPFTSAAGSNLGIVHFGFWSGMTTTVPMLMGLMSSGAATAGLYFSSEAATGAAVLQISDISSSLEIYFSVHYITT
jgi:hypothetical protein